MAGCALAPLLTLSLSLATHVTGHRTSFSRLGDCTWKHFRCRANRYGGTFAIVRGTRSHIPPHIRSTSCALAPLLLGNLLHHLATSKKGRTTNCRCQWTLPSGIYR
ncbi:hypothetical protein BCV69DRAFT_281453 [Microstroma glucosiphilum]|uniref:Secreted protein n=1 Tax=Pseudomicrostroma glucosiphilum TaxID=1684307 RepID=A0A316UDN9_9BASI|nr:hypothetical protein BCV69DRAFT_281453 [Pseudomicrostroma glucosiphilum]PWN22461.1 hypothetical protein BCV69DRAFT_281453 [Pseudomicrostroma glucosiphilum]